MESNFSIRPATEDDLPAILEIENSVYPIPWTAEQFKAEIEKPFANVLVLTDDDTDQIVAGYVVFWMMFDECHILNVAVHPKWRGLGIGGKLTRIAVDFALKKELKRVFLEVRKSNEAAVKLYQKVGFFIDHIKPRFYDNGEDAYFMVMYLTRPNHF